MSEWLVILVIVLIFFGAGKLPEVFAQAGKGIKAFKDASEGKPTGTAADDDDEDEDEAPRPKKKKRKQIARDPDELDDADEEPVGATRAAAERKRE